MWKPPSTKGSGLKEPHKVLLYGHHGWGKTWQVRNFEARYGKGILLSGEKGLKSLADVDIAHVPFTSWDDKHDPDNGVFSFRGLAGWINSKEFRDEGYSWIALDSLTELSEMVYLWAKRQSDAEEAKTGKKNGFLLWELYNEKMLGTLKWIRDLPIHVYVTALASEATDEATASPDYWPFIKGNKTAKAIPAIFDHVFCAIRRDVVKGEEVTTSRYIVTEQLQGWHGKARDPFHRLATVEETDDITELLDRMTRSKEEDEKLKAVIDQAAKTKQAVIDALASKEKVSS